MHLCRPIFYFWSAVVLVLRLSHRGHFAQSLLIVKCSSLTLNEAVRSAELWMLFLDGFVTSCLNLQWHLDLFLLTSLFQGRLITAPFFSPVGIGLALVCRHPKVNENTFHPFPHKTKILKEQRKSCTLCYNFETFGKTRRELEAHSLNQTVGWRRGNDITVVKKFSIGWLHDNLIT